MFKRYWGIFAAFVGLILLGGIGYASYQIYQSSEQERAAYHYEPARTPTSAVIPKAKSTPPGYQPNCNNPQGNSNSDLCAQWAAVDQVMEANRLSSVNVRLALFISLMTLIGTAFVGWTFLETWANSRRQLRAYLDFDGVMLQFTGAGAEPAATACLLKIDVKNFGQTPATDVVAIRTFFLSLPTGEWTALQAQVDIAPINFGIIAQSDVGHFNACFDVPNYIVDALRAGQTQLKVAASISYRDIFGRKQRLACEFYNTDLDARFSIVPDTRSHS